MQLAHTSATAQRVWGLTPIWRFVVYDHAAYQNESTSFCGILPHRIRMYAIYGNIDHQYTPVMLAFFYHTYGSVMGTFSDTTVGVTAQSWWRRFLIRIVQPLGSAEISTHSGNLSHSGGLLSTQSVGWPSQGVSLSRAGSRVLFLFNLQRLNQKPHINQKNLMFNHKKARHHSCFWNHQKQMIQTRFKTPEKRWLQNFYIEWWFSRIQSLFFVQPPWCLEAQTENAGALQFTKHCTKKHRHPRHILLLSMDSFHSDSGHRDAWTAIWVGRRCLPEVKKSTGKIVTEWWSDDELIGSNLENGDAEFTKSRMRKPALLSNILDDLGGDP